MKLFFREHAPLILINIVQLSIVLFILWLDGYRDYLIIFYALFIGIFLLTCYLIYRFLSHKAFYERLSLSINTLDESNQTYGSTPLSEALSQLLKSQYADYISELHQQDKKRSDHLTFINQWVHQMKTPLSVIELIVQGEDDEQLESIREEAEKLGKGLEMVLYAARLEAFEHDFQVEPVALKKVTNQAVQENKRLFIKKHVFPDVEIAANLTVESDEKWLIFILNQLITNAIKYSSSQNQKVTIIAGKDQLGTWIEISDEGIGIPKVDIRRVFNPFYTGENGRLYRESTGMGLYLVKEVCERLGHRIELESASGIGTKVRIFF